MADGTATPPPNTAAALAFLREIAPGDSVTFQTFDDTEGKRGTLARVLIAQAGTLPGELAALNAQGAGVFFTVNATDGRGRKAENVVVVRAVWVDCDTADPARLAVFNSWPLPPSAIIESSPGKHHAYWYVTGWPLERFAEAQKLLAAAFGSDPSVCDLPRVMRLPGFMHRKGEPFLVRRIGGNARRYDAAEIGAMLAAIPKPEALGAAPRGGPPSHSTAGDRYAMRALEAALGAVLTAREGERNATLNREAFGLFGLVKAGRLDAATVRHAFEGLAASNGLEPGEIASTLASAESAATARYDGLTDLPPPSGLWRLRDRTGTAGALVHPSQGWPAPEPLLSKVEPLPYPCDALPDVLRGAVAEVQGFVKAPVPLVAGCALSALSLAVQAHHDVRRAERLTGPSGLFLLTIAESGERKSTADNFFMQAIRDYEKREREKAEPLIQQYTADLKAWDAKRGGITDAIRADAKSGKPTEKLENRLRDVQADPPIAPRYPRLLYGDVTPEELARKLAQVWPSGGVVSAEAGVVFGSHGMGKDSAMRNLALLNTLWDGATLKIDRKTTESFVVEGARLTVSLQVQESALREFFEKTGELARGTGFLARFLVSWPESTRGTRFFEDAPANWPRLAAFNRRVTQLLEAPAPLADNGGLAPAMLELSPGALQAWRAFHDSIEAELGEGGELRDVSDVASKTADNAARLAALFHVFEGEPGAIGAETFERAARITAWHLSESRRFFGEFALPRELADACRLDEWLIRHCRRERTHIVPRRDVARLGPNGLREKQRLDAAIAELASLSRLRDVTDGRRRDLYVNPALLEVDA